MIRSTRRIGAPRLRASLSNVALIHTKCRLHAVHNARVVNEDILLERGFQRAGGVSRRVLTVLLEGAARTSAYGAHVWLAPGDVVVVDAKREVHMRQEGETYASLALEWDAGFFGDPRAPIERTKLSPALLEEARGVWRDARDEKVAGESVVARLLDVLARAEACTSKAPPPPLDEPVPARAQDLTRVLDQALSDLREQPMMRDLNAALGVSPRQLNRIVRDYNVTYGFNAEGWIDTRNRRRLLIGATFMTAPGATASYVAKIVGYRAATAFTRALKLAGLPPPSEIALEIARIGKETSTP